MVLWVNTTTLQENRQIQSYDDEFNKIILSFQKLMIKACLSVKLIKKMSLQASISRSILPAPAYDWSGLFILYRALFFYDNKQYEITYIEHTLDLITLNAFMTPEKIPIWITGWSKITIEQGCTKVIYTATLISLNSDPYLWKKLVLFASMMKAL